MKNTYCLSKKDIEQAKRTGLTRQDVEGQLKIYLQGPVSLHLLRPCTAGDGIMSVTLAAQKRFISLFEKYSKSCTMLKFVPASGAASRMFAEWFQAHSEGGFADYAKEEDFYRNLEKMPFAPLLKGDETARLYFKNKNTQKLLSYILTKKGLNYGWLPKALIHDNAPGSAVYELLQDLDRAWERAARWGARQRWMEMAASVAQSWEVRDGPGRWRLGELTVPAGLVLRDGHVG